MTRPERNRAMGIGAAALILGASIAATGRITPKSRGFAEEPPPVRLVPAASMAVGGGFAVLGAAILVAAAREARGRRDD